ncbi:MAG: transglutaminase family protein [Candidatus Nanopelagicales bacterium]|nr:transglutaminase family protein [Candidatus Nanopelagicales bacterium]
MSTAIHTGRRLRISHHTGYQYAASVEASFNEVRMSPLNGDGQVLLSHELRIEPYAAIQSYTDYWGALVESFDVHTPHRVLEVTSVSTVDIPPMKAEALGGSWHSVHSDETQDRWVEFLTSTSYVDAPDTDVSRMSVVRDLRHTGSPAIAVHAAMEAVRNQITYTPGATNVSTTAGQAWASGVGVCQDFTHAMLSILRALRIPSRYVSGYLHCEEEAMGMTVTGESHAWVEYWDHGWHAIDPTNNRAVGAAHVVVARGRDYGDVPPLKGIYAGGKSGSLGVTVEITQIASTI